VIFADTAIIDTEIIIERNYAGGPRVVREKEKGFSAKN
jgi:hypothetical protein